MRFDWYQASVPDVDPEVVMQALSRSEYYGEWVEAKASKGYDIGADFIVGDQVKYRLKHGGQNAEFGANVTATGGDAPKLAEVLRNQFPRHRVSRADSCQDYHHTNAYPYLRAIGLKIAERFNVAVREITKPLPASDDGCTLYIGSPSSALEGRIYEKAKQLRVGSDFVRVELQVRPQKKVKEVAATLSPQALWGLGKWSTALAVELGQTNIQRVDVQIYQPSDDQRAYRHFLKQYGKLLTRMKGIHGSWETLGAQIGYDLENMDEPQTKTSLRPVKSVS